ncbi:MAG TPA: cupin domain-containing protein [Thermoleophilaceae bacterium]|nr:cupin domain-containing protein [Thermoleophilaceae bacterium]
MTPNIERPHFDEPREQEGFRAQRARLSRQAGAERLGLSLWEVPPGQAAYPYHAHLNEEELVVVLEGTPSLRTTDGWRELEQGEVVSFLRGADGAHQIVNRTDRTIRFLAFSPCGDPDIVLQPDSGKIGAFERRPDGSGMRMWFRTEDDRDYYDGESPPG